MYCSSQNGVLTTAIQHSLRTHIAQTRQVHLTLSNFPPHAFRILCVSIFLNLPHPCPGRRHHRIYVYRLCPRGPLSKERNGRHLRLAKRETLLCEAHGKKERRQTGRMPGEAMPGEKRTHDEMDSADSGGRAETGTGASAPGQEASSLASSMGAASTAAASASVSTPPVPPAAQYPSAAVTGTYQGKRKYALSRSESLPSLVCRSVHVSL